MNVTQTILMMSLVAMIMAQMQARDQSDQGDKPLEMKRDAGDPPTCTENCSGNLCKFLLKTQSDFAQV